MGDVYKVSIGFSKPKCWKPLAALIMLIEGTKFSHTFITWKCENIDRRKVFEAVGSGTRILSNTMFKKKAEVVELYDFYMTFEQLNKLEQICHDLSGTPYGYKALIGLGIMRTFNFFNRILGLKGRQGNPFVDGEYSQVCVEAAVRPMAEAYGVPVPDKIEEWGLLDIKEQTAKHAVSKADQAKLDRINGKVSKKK